MGQIFSSTFQGLIFKAAFFLFLRDNASVKIFPKGSLPWRCSFARSKDNRINKRRNTLERLFNARPKACEKLAEAKQHRALEAKKQSAVDTRAKKVARQSEFREWRLKQGQDLRALPGQAKKAG